MALRPEDVAGHEFVPGFRGYRRDEVRSFLRVVASELEARHNAARRADDARLTRIEQLLETVIADRRPSSTELAACNILLGRTLDELNAIRRDMIEIQQSFDGSVDLSDPAPLGTAPLGTARGGDDTIAVTTTVEAGAATTHARISAGSLGA